VACPLTDVAVSTSDLHPECSPIENSSAEMSPVARQVNAGKLADRKPDNSLESPLGRPTHVYITHLYTNPYRYGLSSFFGTASVDPDRIFLTNQSSFLIML